MEQMAIRKWKATRRPERALEVGDRNFHIGDDHIGGDPTVLVFDNMVSTFFFAVSQFHNPNPRKKHIQKE